MRRLTAVFAALFLSFGAAVSAAADEIPVEVWADTDEVRFLNMSRDGQRIAMLHRTERGAFHRIVVFNTDDVANSMSAINLDEEARPVSVFWKGNDRLVLRVIIERERAGDPITINRFLSINADDSGDVINLLEGGNTGGRSEGAQAMAMFSRGFLASTLPYDDDHVIMGIVTDVNGIPDYYKVNVQTGDRERVLRGNDRYSGFGFDWDGEARSASTYDPDGPRVVTVVREKGDTDWQEIGALDADSRQSFSLLGFYDADNPNVAIIAADTDGSDTQGLFRMDVRNPDRRELIIQEAGFEPQGVIRSPWRGDRGKAIGFSYANGTRAYSYVWDDEWAPLYGNLEATFPDSNVSVLSVSDDRSTTLIYTSGPQDPGTYYLMRNGRLARIIGANSEISSDDLAPTREIIVTARDGRAIPILATIPEGEGPFPGIAMPHGGPWVRDTYGWDEWAAMLANRGYVVMQPNYRGSRGLGRDHWVAGDNEWGQAMQDDVEDAMLHLVEEGIVDRDRMGFFGWSYGGYSAMVAATRNNGLFNCSFAGAAVADIGRIRGGLSGSRYLRQFQQPTITGFNPIEHVGSVDMPMLIVHGEADSTVPVSHSRRWVSGLERTSNWHQYIEIDNMYHSPFYYDQNMQWFPALFDFYENQCGFN